MTSTKPLKLEEAKEGKLITSGHSRIGPYEVRRIEDRFYGFFTELDLVVLTEGKDTREEAEMDIRRIGGRMYDNV